MSAKKGEKVIQYRIEDIQYIKVQGIEAGELIAELEYTRVPKEETIFEERFVGEGICEYCGYPLDKNSDDCHNPDCPKDHSYYDEKDMVDYLNQMNNYKSYVITINDRTYRFKN